MKEISRRVMSNSESGMGCGPVEVYAVDAEIVIEDNNKSLYLHTQWVDACPDEILFEVTTESIYEWYLKLNQLSIEDQEKFDELIQERDAAQEKFTVMSDEYAKEKYAKQYEKLVKMMQKKLDEDEIDFDLSNLDE